MIDAYARSVTLATNSIIPFDNVTLEKGCSATIVGTSTIKLNKAGVYLVQFYAEGRATTAGVVSYSMLVNGVAHTGDTTTILGAGTTSTVTAPIISTIQVNHSDCRCNCKTSPTTIQFQNTGVATVTDANVVVTKIC